MPIACRFLPILLIVLATVAAQGQGVSIEAFTDLEAFKGRMSVIEDGVEIYKRPKSEIGWHGGNDYRMISEEYGLATRLKKTYWAVMRDDTLYLNMRPVMRSSWYSRVLYQTHDILYFRAGIGKVHDPNKAGRVVAAVLFGPLGAAQAVSNDSKTRYHYILDLHTGKPYLLTMALMLEMLCDAPELQLQFSRLKTMPDEDTVIAYLKQINPKISYSVDNLNAHK